MKRNSYFVDHVEGVIVITSSFAKEAGKYGTEAYKLLAECRKKFPGYAVEKRTVKLNSAQNRYKGLTYDEMQKYIMDHDRARLAEFMHLKTNTPYHVASYAEVKKWFLNKYKKQLNQITSGEQATEQAASDEQAA